MKFILFLAVLCLPFVYLESFSDVQIFDDQGALMIGFRDLMRGRALYHDVFALYGPFYYESILPLFSVLYVPLTHDAGRAISAAFWLAISIALAGLSYRISHSPLAGACTFLIALFVLKLLTHSPLHPQELTFLLVVLLLHAICGIERRIKTFHLPIVGFICAGLLLTKINLAAFVTLPLLLGALRAANRHLLSRILLGTFLVAGLAMPITLISPLFHFSWAVEYCAFSTSIIFATTLVWLSCSVPEMFKLRHWFAVLAGFLVTAMASIAIAMTFGATAYEVLDAVVLQNFGRVRSWYIPMKFGFSGPAVAVISAGFAILYAIASRFPKGRSHGEFLVGAAKVLVGSVALAVFALSILIGRPWQLLPQFSFEVLTPFAWLFAVPPADVTEKRPLVRTTVAMMASYLSLYAFPVAGGQIVLASLLPTALAPVLLHDGLTYVRRLWAHSQGKPDSGGVKNRKSKFASVSMAIVAVAALLQQTYFSLRQFQALVPLDLPGSILIRAGKEDVANYRWATDEASRCPVFYVVPGFLSLYFWTGQTAPTAMNNNNMLGLLNEPQQVHVVADISRYNNLCVLKLPLLLELFDRGQISAQVPILKYIDDNFIVIKSHGPFQLLVRRSRASTWRSILAQTD